MPNSLVIFRDGMVAGFVGENHLFGAEMMPGGFGEGGSESTQGKMAITFRRGRPLLPHKLPAFPQSDHVGLPRFRANWAAH
jgi:hypothetical protein